MTTRLKQGNRTAQKPKAAAVDAAPAAAPAMPASGRDFAAGMFSANPRDDRRAVRRSQMPARVVSAVKDHKYEVGQVLSFTPGALTLGAALGLYEIVRRLPPEGPENQYRVKSVQDSHERVVRESQLA